MDDSLITYDESSYTEESAKELKRFKIQDTNSDNKIAIKIETTEPRLRRFVNLYNKKEFFYIKAVKNLIVQNNFLELALQLEEGHIEEEEYDAEIDAHPEKYVVNVDYLENPNDLSVIKDILKKIGIEYTRDEVSELFSIDSDSLDPLLEIE